MNTRNLRFRINAAIWTVSVVIAVCFGMFFYAFESQRRHSRMEQIRVLLGAVFQQKREAMANEIFAGQTEALARSFQEIRDVRGIAAVRVFGLGGEPILTSGDHAVGHLTPQERSRLDAAPIYRQILLQDRAYAEYLTAIEVIGERVGYLSMYFDLFDMVSAAHQRLLLFIAIFGSTLVAMSVVLYGILTHSVIRPVSSLRDAMARVMRGGPGEKVSLDRKDEIGEVAEVFNDMSTRLREQQEALMRSMESRDSYAEKLQKTNRELERLNLELESRVEERTRELRSSYEQLQRQSAERQRADREKKVLEERLARSQKMEALGLLAGGVAHDLNNVLSGIVSYPDLILMELPEDSGLRRPVETIRESGKKAAAIVQDLLTLARRGVTNTEVLDFNRDVVLDTLQSPESQKLSVYHPHVKIETRLTPGLLPIRGSSVHLKKMLLNLLSNAAEAQPDGGAILVSTEDRYVDRPLSGYDRVNEGDYVVLRVEDSGIGIAAEDLNRIFEPFYTKKVMGRSGTGLGMAVVWGTVQDHEGYINVTSSPGRGTVFELFFPVTREKIEKAGRGLALGELMGSGEKVLVVDDVVEQREIAAMLLQRLNYRVDTVASGEEAIVYLDENRADILVLDMIMDPGMDGLETYRRVLERHPGQKVVIASGFAESERVKQAQALGAGAYVRKPYTIDRIGAALRDELRGASGPPAGPPPTDPR